jgi:hypothetical protein
VGTTAIPALIDALVAQANTSLADNILVLDGFGVTADPAEQYLFIGVDDVDSMDQAFSASAAQEWAHANYTARDEEGYVVCAAGAWNGDGDQKAARDDAFAIVNAMETALRANPSLGVSTLLWTSVGTRIALSQNQSESGASAVVVFNVTYRARI